MEPKQMPTPISTPETSTSVRPCGSRQRLSTRHTITQRQGKQ